MHFDGPPVPSLKVRNAGSEKSCRETAGEMNCATNVDTRISSSLKSKTKSFMQPWTFFSPLEESRIDTFLIARNTNDKKTGEIRKSSRSRDISFASLFPVL
jgi:hypothetical protein